MGRQDKGVPCLSLGSRGLNFWGSSAPSHHFIPENCVYVSLIYPGQCFSRPTVTLSPPPLPISSSLSLSHSLKMHLRESDMATIKMDGIPVETVDRRIFVHFCLEPGASLCRGVVFFLNSLTLPLDSLWRSVKSALVTIIKCSD